MNQNLTVLLVLRITLKIMIDAKRCERSVSEGSLCLTLQHYAHFVEHSGSDGKDVYIRLLRRDCLLVCLRLENMTESENSVSKSRPMEIRK
jgi:hypothetical protein